MKKQRPRPVFQRPISREAEDLSAPQRVRSIRRQNGPPGSQRKKAFAKPVPMGSDFESKTTTVFTSEAEVALNGSRFDNVI